MACKSPYELHHHFPKLAEESGFSFNTLRPRKHIDWNKIRSIDIHNLIRERKFVLLEQTLHEVLDCVLESEFDVRILDEGVLKMFRLAQLTVEYQQFCRQYLDRSVFVLREEINALAQELDATKKAVREKEEEIRKLRKRTRHSFKSPLPYNNDNIATMILKTLTNKGDNIFPNTSSPDALHYNRCGFCDKVFLNQLYLQSHLKRRHPNVIDIAQKDQDNIHENENTKLTSEILALKIKLKEMENLISNVNKHNGSASNKEADGQTLGIENDRSTMKETKDERKAVRCAQDDRITLEEVPLEQHVVKDQDGRNIVKEVKEDRNIVKEKNASEVLPNNDENLLNKFEQWKREEHEKHNRELLTLRNQIMDTINSLKEKEISKTTSNDMKAMEQFQATIIQQGAEILLLKKELNNSKAKRDDEDAKKHKEAQAQLLLWSKRADAQTKQYELLLQKLNQVAQDAQESRALAEAEKERAANLQNLLQQSVATKTPIGHNDKLPESVLVLHKKSEQNPNKPKSKTVKSKSVPVPDRNTFEQLHRKAQELLNIGSSSSSSDSSGVKFDHVVTESKVLRKKKEVVKAKKANPTVVVQQPYHTENKESNQVIPTRENKKQRERNKTIQRVLNENISKPIPGSPVKVVRAKLTEEVNNRLVAAGVDPLKNGIPRNIFQKQRLELQQHLESKCKKNPTHEKVRHSILAFLDTSTTDLKKEVTENGDISPKLHKKPFKGLNSVISNVKSKALSLVKMNEASVRNKRRPTSSEVAKRALNLLKTPPGSETSSSLSQRYSPVKDIGSVPEVIRSNGAAKVKNDPETKLNVIKKITNSKAQIEQRDNENTDTSESDHNYYNSAAIVQQSSKSIDSLIKSPARRPSSANMEHNTIKKYTIDNGDRHLLRTQSETNITQVQSELNNLSNKQSINYENSSDDAESLTDNPMKKIAKEKDDNKVRQTKSVLKNASSTSSLNKKKVLFDMDAIQMKSVSASPSQSTKSEANEQYELGLVNLDGEEWDISSIDNEPLKNDKIIINARTSPKIAELTQTIESQLARRNQVTRTLAGGVDLMAGSVQRAASVGGSNTSLGSSILDESEPFPLVNQKAFVKSKKVTEKDDSEVDISEFSIEGSDKKNGSF